MDFLEFVDSPFHIADFHLQILQVDLVGNGHVGLSNSSRVDYTVLALIFAYFLIGGL